MIRACVLLIKAYEMLSVQRPSLSAKQTYSSTSRDCRTGGHSTSASVGGRTSANIGYPCQWGRIKSDLNILIALRIQVDYDSRNMFTT
jgi:hypothetical protein